MKALSLKQPWATLLVRGIKKVETRSWASKSYPSGRLYIHASLDFGKEEIAALRNFAERGFFDLNEEIWTTGDIIGYVNLVGCMSAKDYHTLCHYEDQKGQIGRGFSPEDWKRECILGNLTGQRRTAWICNDPVMFKEPIPCSGSLSVWDIPTDIQEEIKKQL